MTRITDYTSLGTAAAGDVLPIVDISDTSMSSAGTTKQITMAGLMAQTYTGISILDPAYDGGAFTDGSSDSTAAIQAAMDAAAPFGCPVFIPGGILFRITSLTWNEGQVLQGVYCGSYPADDTITTASVLSRMGSSNEDMLVVPDTINYGRISDLAFDGNKNNNTAGYGINIEDGAAGQECQILIERCFIHDNPYSNVYLGYQRRANKIIKSVLNYSAAGDGVTVAGSDNLITECIIGSNFRAGVNLGTTETQNWSALNATGYVSDVCHVFNNDIYQNQVAIAVPQSCVNAMIIGNGIDRQTLQGITVYDGNANTIVANSFHSNGTSANNTYGHIDLAAGVTQVVISDNNFGPQDSGEPNVAAYCVTTESGITTGSIIGNIGQADSTAYATAFISAAGSNTSPSVLLSRGGAMIRNTQAGQHVFQIENHAGTIVFDMTDAGTFSVNDGVGKFQAGISGGNGHTAQALTANGDTIATTTCTHLPVTCAANYTGTILAAGAEDGQIVTVVNISTSSGSVTFAAAGTSNVAQGASVTIPVNGKQIFEWDASTALWY